MADSPIFIDGLKSFEAGINSGIAPLLLPPNQLSFATNATVRGAFVTHRPSYRKIELDYGGDATLQSRFEEFLWQGGTYFKSEYGAQSLVVSIGGRLFEVTPGSGVDEATATVVERTIFDGTNYDINPSNIPQAWLWQSERWVIVNDGQSLPIFFDGQTSRRSNGPGQNLGTSAADWVAPAVGATVSVTLTAPYTGPFNETVLVDNEAFYQVTQGSNVYPVTLEAIEENSVGVTFPNNTPVFVPTNLIGIQDVTDTTSFSGNLTLSFATPVTLTTNQIVWAHINSGGLYANLRILAGGTGTSFTAQSLAGTITVRKGSGIFPANPAYSWDNTRLATSFVQPAVGTSFTANFDKLYTGPLPQMLSIAQNLFRITAVLPEPPPSNIITIENVSDTPGNDRGPTGADGLGIFTTVPEMEVGRMGDYGMGRNWYSLPDGRSYRATDIVGGPSGSPAYNFRDAVLKETENTFLTTGDFVIPGNIGDIRSMRFTANLDTSLGQGPLQIGTPNIIFSCNAPVDRTTWQDLENPIQTESLKGQGTQGQNSTILSNSDMLFRSLIGSGSLILARRDFNNVWGNTPISREIQRIIDQDDVTLLNFGSAVNFGNRKIETSKPTQSAQGVFHRGAMVLNFEPISSLAGKAPSIYDGLWLGINVLQWIVGQFGGVERAFAFCYNNTVGRIELYELLEDGAAFTDDNDIDDETRIKWAFESACLFQEQRGKGLFDTVQLQDGEFYLADVRGTVDFAIYYRPQFFPCWILWHEGQVCAEQDPEDVNIQRQNRVAIGIGRPSPQDCDPVNNRPYAVSESFQFKFVFTGSAKFYGAVFKASLVNRPALTKVSCDPICIEYASENCEQCKRLDCVVDNDYDLYVLEDELPPPEPETFFNDQVVYNGDCEDGEELEYTGTLPNWITLNGNQLVGAAGTFQAETKADANALAQQQLNDFAASSLLAGDLECGGGALDPCTDGIAELLNNCYQIQGYFDGMITNPTPVGVGGDVWDGVFSFTNNVETWAAHDPGADDLQIDGGIVCNPLIVFLGCVGDVPQWRLIITSDIMMWNGDKAGGDTPEGDYTNDGTGSNATPLTLTIEISPGTTTVSANPVDCGS